jgi:transposase
MRGEDKKQSAMFSYVSLERRIPMDHPLRSIRSMADRALEQMSSTFDGVYSVTGRPSIAPERLIRGLLLQVLYSVRSERQLIEQLDYNLLFRWFVGLEMDDEVWDVTVFTKNRERLIEAKASEELLACLLEQAQENNLLSEEHFTVDGTLIQAWASARSFKEKSDPPPPGEGSGHKGEVLLRDKVESETDSEARLFKKATADKSVPCYQGHAVIENRNGLVVGRRGQPISYQCGARSKSEFAGSSSGPSATTPAEPAGHGRSRYPVSGREIHRGPAPARDRPARF